MKKRWIRLTAVVMVCVCLCTSLCGCSVIDDLRTANASLLDDGTIVWNGVNYKPLDGNLSEQIWFVDVDYERSVYVNPDNVPILLMSIFCAEYNPTENDVFLVSYSGYVEGFGSYTQIFDAKYYCREDRYKDVMRQLCDGLELTGLFYQFWRADSGEIGIYSFSEEECAAFRDVLTPMNRWNTPVYGKDWSTTVYPCTSDGLVGDEVYEILQDDGAYYIAYYPYDYYADFGPYGETDEELTEYYRVPLEYYDLFNVLLMDSVQEQTMAYEDYYGW